jgi:predicted O-methyltransferase YrrM
VTQGGTSAYTAERDVPELVMRAVTLAVSLGFDNSCVPAQGRLLQVMVRGRPGAVVGETGTGCGVGLAWIATAADPSTKIVSVERDNKRAAKVTELFAGLPNVTVLNDDWRRLLDHGPFDILVLDGGGSGKGPDNAPIEPAAVLKRGGSLIIDDLSPRLGWPPTWDGSPDATRLHWLEHPQLLATEITVTPDMVTIVGTRR